MSPFFSALKKIWREKKNGKLLKRFVYKQEERQVS